MSEEGSDLAPRWLTVDADDGCLRISGDGVAGARAAALELCASFARAPPTRTHVVRAAVEDECKRLVLTLRARSGADVQLLLLVGDAAQRARTGIAAPPLYVNVPCKRTSRVSPQAASSRAMPARAREGAGEAGSGKQKSGRKGARAGTHTHTHTRREKRASAARARAPLLQSGFVPPLSTPRLKAAWSPISSRP